MPPDFVLPLSEQDFAQAIAQIEALPGRVAACCDTLSRQGRMDQSYREGGWTAAQLVSHLADAMGVALVRAKLALTALQPDQHAWDENAWANLADSDTDAWQHALKQLEGVHGRMAMLARSLSVGQRQRVYYHIGKLRDVTLDETLAFYAWHGDHHLAQLESI